MLAYIFPGQGSQQKGMGSDLFERFPELTKRADEILGYSIKQLCLEDTCGQLGLTQFTQPALYCVSSLSYLKCIEDKNIKPDFVAGHSLGEFVALFAAGAFDFETGLRLVKKRGELMGNISDGGMAAIIGLNEQNILEILKRNELYGIDIANYNTPSQIVISATKKDIENAKLFFEVAGALKYVVLNVSGAFHSRHMDAVKTEFEEYLDTIKFNKLNIPVISNFYARPYKDDDLKATLANQITGAVNWTESIRYLMGCNVDDIQQIGPGNILTGLVKAIKREATPLNIEDNKNSIADNKPDAPEINITADLSEEDIAIIGLSGRYPMAEDLDGFWRNLISGKDCITEIPENRWNNSRYFDPDKSNTRKYYSKWGGFLENIDEFDASFFNISPKEAEVIDPQERLFLQTVWHTIEDAGYKKDMLSGSDMGVFVGVMFGQYQLLGAEEFLKGNTRFSETSYASIANRASFFLNLHGPSIAIDTMCSSSLVAVHMACESIKRGECETAIAGGVNLSLHPIKYYLLSQKRLASSDGRCRTFGERGEGYVPGEGVGAVFLKPLKKAIQDGDNIYAVIKGSAINHGGKTNGYTVPNPIAQSEVVLKALKKTGISPRTISYVEAHGTGTALGDPIEINGLNMAYVNYSEDKQYCSIGSLKTNIGHLESAAGIASLTKVLLQMKYKQLVPSIHSDELNSLIDFQNSPFYVQHKLENWKRPVISEDGVNMVYPRRAGISSFGAGGVNTHIILEEYDGNKTNSCVQDDGRYIFILSAKKKNILKEYARNFVSFIDSQIDKNTCCSIRDIAYTLQVGRTEMEQRIAFTASNLREIREKLLTFIDRDEYPEDFYQGNSMINKENSVLSYAEGMLDYKDLSNLSQLWVSGAKVDWNLLYKEEKPNRIQLPTYPFSKTKYWIQQQNGIFQNVKEILQQVKTILEQVEMIIEPSKSSNAFSQVEFSNKADNFNPQSDITVKLRNSLEFEKNEIVLEHIRKLTADFLSYIPPELPEIYLDFIELGMDSVTILNFKLIIEREFDIEFPSSILYEYSTIEKLSEYIIDIIKSAEKDKAEFNYEGSKKNSEAAKENELKDSSSDSVLKLLDTIISSEEKENNNSEFSENDLLEIINNMGVF